MTAPLASAALRGGAGTAANAAGKAGKVRAAGATGKAPKAAKTPAPPAPYKSTRKKPPPPSPAATRRKATKSGSGRHRAAGTGHTRSTSSSSRHAASGQAWRDAKQVKEAAKKSDGGLMKYTPGAQFKRAMRTGSAKGRAPGQRLLVAEFLICTILLALSPLALPAGQPSAKNWIKRGSALCGVFIVLGLIGSAGPRASRVAGALGGIITLTLAVDQRSVFKLIADKMKVTVGPGDTGEATLLPNWVDPNGDDPAVPAVPIPLSPPGGSGMQWI